VAPPEDYELYRDRITEADLPDPDPDGLHPLHVSFRERWGLDPEPPRSAQLRTRLAYYGMCTFTDRIAGRVLAALESAGLADDTLVVYASDHGEQLGEHGLWWKSTFYQGSVGVPLLMAGPGIPGGREVTGNVGLMDLGPTLLDLAGADPLPAASGRSFRGLLGPGASDWADEVFAENYRGAGEGTAQRMVRRGPWKLNYYHGARPQLFNLADDPLETADRWDDPACRDILADLQERVLDGWDPARMEARLAERHCELELYGRWLQRNPQQEPDPPWFTTPPENVILDAGSEGRPADV
jgi:choline-sulfatase